MSYITPCMRLGASARVRRDRQGFVADPDDPAVLGDDSVLLVERVPSRSARADASITPGAIVGVDVLVPERGRRHPLLGGVAEEALHLRADVGGANLVRGGRRVPRVGDRRHLLDERAEASFGLFAERTFAFGSPEAPHGHDRERRRQDHEDREQVVGDDGRETFEPLETRPKTSKATPMEKAASATTEIQIRSRFAPAGLGCRSDASLGCFTTVPSCYRRVPEAP